MPRSTKNSSSSCAAPNLCVSAPSFAPCAFSSSLAACSKSGIFFFAAVTSACITPSPRRLHSGPHYLLLGFSAERSHGGSTIIRHQGHDDARDHIEVLSRFCFSLRSSVTRLDLISNSGLARVSKINSRAAPESEQRVGSFPGIQPRSDFTATKLRSCAGGTSRDVYLEDVYSKEALSTITSP